jgi:uncharacterized membrane protein (UPF0182 family)
VVPAVLIVVAGAILISVTAGIWTDYLWYSSVGQGRVFTTTFTTKWLLFLIVGLLMVLTIGANIVLAYRLRPEEPPAGPEHQSVEAYRQAIDPHRRAVAAVLLGLIGLISGITATSGWQTWLMFINRVPFGIKDPQFHLDLSFFVFVYPFIRWALSFLFAAILLSLIFATAVHVLYGGLRLSRHPRPTTGARVQLFVLAGLFVTLKAVAYWVDRYGINFSQRGIVQTGASYTDVHAVLPAKTVLAVIAVICAALFFAGAARRTSLLPGIAFGLLVVSAIVIGGIYPFVIQQFVVRPNEQVKERPYITREITATRAAYNVGDTRVRSYQASPNLPIAKIATEAAALPNLRLLDPRVVSSAYQQLQQVKGYYHFAGVLAMDRYLTGATSQPQDMVVGVRDMLGPPAGQGSWINTHLIYTHGYGIVAAPAAVAQNNGNPAFTQGDIPPSVTSGPLQLLQPRVYFGHEGAGYVIAGTRQAELDYPNESTGGQQNNTYSGGGGVPVGSFLNRLLFAVKFRDINILLSGAIEPRSRILYVRDPLARVAKVAPFLTLDGDPYPVVVNGQILWVVDGYTTTDNYPYSQRISLSHATSNTYSPGGLAAGPSDEINYIRNSVKATVNAYTGAVHLYQWQQASPVLQAWMKTFPGLISPEKDIPAALKPHLRYPEVLFDVQRQILTQFHLLPSQPTEFYGGQNFWAVPGDPTLGLHAGISQPPYYLTLDMPGPIGPQFSLATLLTPRSRANLAAFVAVDSNPLSPDYGTIRILQLPQSTAILGPEQVQSKFETFGTASKELSLFRTGGSRVMLGNLVTVPLAGGLLSAEPVYLEPSAPGNTGAFPTLQRVFAYYNGSVGYAPTLTEALAQAIGGTGSQAPGQGTTTPPGGRVSAAVRLFLAQAEHFYAQAQAALRSGNLALYYTDILKMKAALDQANHAAQGSATAPGHAHVPSPTPSPSRSP